ncbi:DUF7344 domain-containing protein [Halorubrum sp. HHNYT27]|uniref:DUF7344 domain-containing protein n=1 Tax=Halorubrum sp. HHNYT27 TaxID=3402275 RepID=UPI003EBBC772
MSTTQDSSAGRPRGLEAADARRTVAALADDAAETVGDLRVRSTPDEVADELRETHLPALEEAGYIEWDRETGTIAPGPNFEEAAAHVADLPDLSVEPADD